MKVKRSITLALLLVLLVSATGFASDSINGMFEGYPVVKIVVNGNPVESDVPAINFYGRTMVPIRFVTEAMGASVDWDAETWTASVVSSGAASEATAEPEPIPVDAGRMVALDHPFLIAHHGPADSTDGFTTRVGRSGAMQDYYMQLLYARLKDYADYLRNNDSVVLFDVASEPLEALKDWPTAYAYALPFSFEELAKYNLPLAWFREDASGHLRGIVVIDGDNSDFNTVAALTSRGFIPVNVPTTVDAANKVAHATLAKEGTVSGRFVGTNDHFRTLTTNTADGTNLLTWADEALTALETVFKDAGDIVPKVSIITTGPNRFVGYGDVLTGYVLDPPLIKMVSPTLAASRSPEFDESWYKSHIAYGFMFCLNQRYSVKYAKANVSDRLMPAWFTKGLSEYAKLIALGEMEFDSRMGDVYSPRIPRIISDGLSSVDAWSGGIWALRYIADKWGNDKISDLLKSSVVSFDGAIQSVLGVTPGELERGLKEWLGTR